MSLSHAQLRRWYRTYNARYFGNALPADMDVFYAPNDENHAEATWHGNGERLIQIDTKVAGTRYAKGDLLHEMCHHHTNDWTHGAKFQAGMSRLFSLGAFRRIL